MRKLLALLSDQGTAADETCICEQCAQQPALKTSARANALRDVPKEGEFQDVSGNEACACIFCGYGEVA